MYSTSGYRVVVNREGLRTTKLSHQAIRGAAKFTRKRGQYARLYKHANVAVDVIVKVRAWVDRVLCSLLFVK